ncbi:MAG: ACT domain-containing protein [Pseudomonas sp.]
MTVPLIITVIAADKPGLVENLAQVIKRHGGNWLDSRMARMGGQFAGILRVDIASGGVDSLHDELRQLANLGISIQLAVSGEADPTPQQQLFLSLVGNDRPGIVHEVSAILSRHGINVEHLKTRVEPAPMSSELLFHARAHLSLLPQTDTEALRADLESLADELIVELSTEELSEPLSGG